MLGSPIFSGCTPSYTRELNEPWYSDPDSNTTIDLECEKCWC